MEEIYPEGAGVATAVAESDLEVSEIQIDPVDKVVVGEEFVVRFRTVPAIPSGFPHVSVKEGPEYEYFTRKLKPYEIQDPEFQIHQQGIVAYPKGVYLTFYGLVKVTEGEGEIRVTQFSLAPFTLEVRIGNAAAELEIAADQVVSKA